MSEYRVTDFLTRYPNFSVVDAHIIQNTLDMSSEVFCAGTPWLEQPVKRELGVYLCSAHVLTMDWLQTSEVVGAASSLASGSPGRSPTATENDFQLTTYGRQYLAIKASLIAIGVLM